MPVQYLHCSVWRDYVYCPYNATAHATDRARNRTSNSSRLDPRASAAQQGDQKNHQEHNEEDFCHPSRGARQGKEPQGARDEGDQEKHECVIQHEVCSIDELNLVFNFGYAG